MNLKLVTEGEYSDYHIVGIYDTEIDLQKMYDEWLSKKEEKIEEEEKKIDPKDYKKRYGSRVEILGGYFEFGEAFRETVMKDLNLKEVEFTETNI